MTLKTYAPGEYFHNIYIDSKLGTMENDKLIIIHPCYHPIVTRVDYGKLF